MEAHIETEQNDSPLGWWGGEGFVASSLRLFPPPAADDISWQLRADAWQLGAEEWILTAAGKTQISPFSEMHYLETSL